MSMQCFSGLRWNGISWPYHQRNCCPQREFWMPMKRTRHFYPVLVFACRRETERGGNGAGSLQGLGNNHGLIFFTPSPPHAPAQAPLVRLSCGLHPRAWSRLETLCWTARKMNLTALGSLVRSLWRQREDNVADHVEPGEIRMRIQGFSIATDAVSR